MELLRVRDLSIRYGDREVLHSVNLALGAGEFAGLAGPSGSGKSTLALAILNALPSGAVLSGEVAFSGVAMAPVFQEATGALHPLMRVGRQVEEVLRARRRPGRAFAEAALESVGLRSKEYYQAYPHELSGGEKQRVLLAQAIAAQPDLLIADEPTASLDAATGQTILDLLLDLRARRGMAMLLISHSPELLARFGDRILTMRDGALV